MTEIVESTVTEPTDEIANLEVIQTIRLDEVKTIIQDFMTKNGLPPQFMDWAINSLYRREMLSLKNVNVSINSYLFTREIVEQFLIKIDLSKMLRN